MVFIQCASQTLPTAN